MADGKFLSRSLQGQGPSHCCLMPGVPASEGDVWMCECRRVYQYVCDRDDLDRPRKYWSRLRFTGWAWRWLYA